MRIPGRGSAALVALVLTAGVAALPAASPAIAAGKTLKQVAIYGDMRASTVSSTGHRLYLEFEVDHNGTGRNAETDVWITAARGGPRYENHTWEVDGVPASDYSYDPATGDGSIHTGHAFGAFGALDLSWTGARHTTTKTCQAPAQVVRRRVTVAGTITLNTRSRGPQAWGRLRASDPTRLDMQATSEADYGSLSGGCGYTPACGRSVGWNTPSSWRRSHSGIFGESDFQNGRRYTSELGDWFSPASQTDPENVEREDDAIRYIPLPHAQRLHDGGIKMHLRSDRAHGVLGSATLTAHGKPKFTRIRCGSRKERLWYWPNAVLRDGHEQYRLANQIFGDDVAVTGRHGYVGYAGQKPPKR